MRRTCLALIVVVVVAAPPGASAGWHPRSYEPPHGRAFHGVSGTVGKERDFQRFRGWVGAHPAVLQAFFPWGTSLTHGALPLWHRTSTRGMLSLGTRIGDREIIRPGQIARGHGDGYIVRLNRSIAAHSHQVVYIRLMAEMNGSWNAYCAYNADGSARGHGHSTRSFRRAWRRFTLIIRGGNVARINARLRAMDMPAVRAKGVGRRLPHPKVAMVWNPQTIGSPAVSGNAPRRYWPGRRYVDWVGADIYSKFASPGIRAALSRFYADYRGLPFEIGEYSPWDADPGAKVHEVAVSLVGPARARPDARVLPLGLRRRPIRHQSLRRRA